MKINLGCWRFKIPGWTNIDIDKSVEPDTVADALHLPFTDGSVEEIYAGHLLEHVSHNEMNAALAEWKRVLIPGGRLTVTVPDIVKACDIYRKGEEPMGWLWGVVFGAVDRDPQRHQNIFDGKYLAECLGRHFSEVEEVFNTPLAPYHVGWQTTYTCKKV